MMRRREKDEVLEAPEIPLDLLIEILNRLPLKSLARFKCVSKLWSSVISSKSYRFTSPPRLFVSLQNSNKCLLLSLASTSKSTAFDTSLDMIVDGFGGYFSGALRGLILYNIWGDACIYNPTTGQKINLPPAINILTEKEDEINNEHYFLGYDPVLDQYKVVYTVELWLEKAKKSYLQHWVFVLEAGSSWKRISSSCLDIREVVGPKFNIHFPVKEPHLHFPFPSSQGLCINGVVYYSAYCLSCRCKVIIVISFDVKSEEFDMIQAPSVVYEYWNSNHLELIEYGGKLTIFDHRHQRDQSGLLNLWVLEYAGKWSKKSLVLHSCNMNFFPSNISFQVIGTTQNGEVVLKPVQMSSHHRYILFYDLHKNDVRRVDIKGISKEYQKNIRIYPLCFALMDTGESIMHLKI